MAINMATLPELDPTEGRRMRALGQDLGQNDLTNHWAASIRGKGDERGWGVACREGGQRWKAEYCLFNRMGGCIFFTVSRSLGSSQISAVIVKCLGRRSKIKVGLPLPTILDDHG